MGAKLDRTR